MYINITFTHMSGSFSSLNGKKFCLLTSKQYGPFVVSICFLATYKAWREMVQMMINLKWRIGEKLLQEENSFFFFSSKVPEVNYMWSSINKHIGMQFFWAGFCLEMNC